MNNFTLLISFEYVHEAHIVQGSLESNDIIVFLQDVLTIQENHFYSNAIGGVKIFVHESQIEEATHLLKAGGYLAENGGDLVSKVKHYKTESKHRNICPHCQSKNFAINKKANWLTVLSYFIIGSFLPVYSTTYHCFDCKEEWKWAKADSEENNI